jgi:hypothetical protein
MANTIDVSSVLTSLSRRKKKTKKGRSLMLSEIMPLLSGSLGEQVQTAIEQQDGDKVKQLMTQVGEALRTKYAKK